MAQSDRKAYEKAYYLANKEKYASRDRKWRAENPDRVKELNRASKARNVESIVAYRQRTKEQRAAWQIDYDRAHREQRRRHSITWRENNPVKYAASQQRWRDENGVAYTASRRSLKHKATPLWLTDKHRNEIKAIYRQAKLIGMEVDHIVPLKHPDVCGLHVPWNLQLLTPRDNKIKGNRLATDAAIPE